MKGVYAFLYPIDRVSCISMPDVYAKAGCQENPPATHSTSVANHVARKKEHSATNRNKNIDLTPYPIYDYLQLR